MTRIATRLGSIGVAEVGAGDAIPLVFLHGVGSDKSAWALQLKTFGAQRRTVAIDYPGYGESDPACPSGVAPHDNFGDAMLAAFDALEIERAHICGLSLGGVVAIGLAHRAPQRVASLVIADSFARHPDGDAILARSLAASDDMRGLAEARIPTLLAPNPEPALAAALVAVMAAIDPAAFRLGSAAVWPADQRDRAASLLLPTLILCGSDDLVTPPSLSRELAAIICGARIEIIAQAGHLPNLEQRTAFNSAVQRFLTETEAIHEG